MSIIPTKDEAKKETRTYILIVLFGALSLFGEKVWDSFQTGVDVEFSTDVKAVINKPETIRAIFENEETKKIVAGIKLQGQQEMIKRESEKVGLRSIIGQGTKTRDSDVGPLLIDIVNAWKLGPFINHEKCLINIQENTRGRTTLMRQ